MEKIVYLDNAATTKPYPEVVEGMKDYYTNKFYNPSSLYSQARDVRKDLDTARLKIATTLNCKPQEIIFTSGGTESNNWAIKGVLQKNKKKGKHIIISAIEHHSIYNLCKKLTYANVEVTFLPVDEHGIVDVKTLSERIKPDTALVSIMFANNEIGTIEPIKEIGEVCREKGVIFHTDAVQAYGHVDINVEEMKIDLLSASAHKFHGPKGVGFLYKKEGVSISPWTIGGAQEHLQRAGTENTPAIIGMGIAAEIIEKRRKVLKQKGENTVRTLRDYFIERILNEIPNTCLNGHPMQRLANNVNIGFSFIEGESLVFLLDKNGIACSTGSACASESLESSHVLLAIGRTHEQAHGSVRFTLSEETTKEEIDYTIVKLKENVEALRRISPLKNVL